MKKILFVDDDPFILKALELVIFKTDYKVFFAESGMAALSIMEGNEIDLVVSDMRMPVMNGYKFLQRVKTTWPNVIRVILAGSADEKMVIKALQNNIAKIYLFKPWENKVLLELIENLLKTEDLLLSNHFLSTINNAEELPTIKASYKKIMELAENDAELEEITEAIEQDQSITGKLLHIANSAFYGLRTASVTQAVKYLGFNTLRNVVLSTPVIESMQFSGADAKYIEKQWKHAYLTNKLMYFIYGRYLHKSIAEVEGTAGLLHNIGTAFLLKHFQAEYLKLLKNDTEETQDLIAMERGIFHVTHSEAGGYLLNWWELPYPVVEAALFHHEPFDEKIINKDLVMTVHLSQYYANSLLQYPHTDQFFDGVFDTLKIGREKFEKDIAGISLI